MAITKKDLQSFNRFADAKLENGRANSLIELAYEWETRRDEDGTGIGDRPIQVDEATIQELANAFPDVHDEAQQKRALERRDGVTTAEMLGKAVLAAARAGRL